MNKFFTYCLAILIIPALLFSKTAQKNQMTPAKLANKKLQHLKNNYGDRFANIKSKSAIEFQNKLNEKYNNAYYKGEAITMDDSKVILSKTQDGEFLLISELYQYRENNAWVNAEMYTYTYDQNNNMTEMTYEYWNNSSWETGWRGTFKYDGNNNMTEELYENWEESEWLKSSIYLYRFDANNNITEILHQDWNAADWLNHWQEEREYDGNSNIVSWISNTNPTFNEGEGTNSDWIKQYGEMYSYDGNNTTELIWQSYDAGELSDQGRILYSYDSDLLIEQIQQIWAENDWMNSSISSLSYDEENNLVEEIFQSGWNGSTWTLNIFKSMLVYDNNNNTESYWYDWVESNWFNSSRTFSTYNANDDRTEILSQQRTSQDTSWVDYYKNLSTYDDNSNLTINETHYYFWDEAYKDYYYYDDNNNRIEAIYQYWDNSFWQSDWHEIYTYSSITSIGKDEAIAHRWHLERNYPNPFNPQTTIEFSILQASYITLKIYDINGQEVRELVRGNRSSGSHSVVWDATNNAGVKVASGVYMYSLISEAGVMSKKMILVK